MYSIQSDATADPTSRYYSLVIVVAAAKEGEWTVDVIRDWLGV